MSKNRLADLNDHLFMQMERLGDEDLTSEQIDKEATRAKAMVDVADKIISNANLTLSACKFVAEHGEQHLSNLPMLKAPPTPYAKQDYAGTKKQ